MSLTMKGASRLSLITTRSALDNQLSGLDFAGISRLSSDLFEVVKVLDSSISLRRALTDSARTAEDKLRLASDIFSKAIGKEALALVSQMAGLRWSSPKDLADVIESLAVEMQAAAAEKDGTLDRLESEIFAFSQIVASNIELRSTLSDRSVVAGRTAKSKLVAALLDGKACESTIKLISAFVDHPRGRNIEAGLADFAVAVAALKSRLIVHVASSTELTSAQIERLSASLSKKVGKQVTVNVEIDRSLIGGLSIRFADELIDGTILTRMVEADRALAGKSA
ncbi:MAG: F0F1 ATP synthase subunit delta [Actinomycetota bacterium]